MSRALLVFALLALLLVPAQAVGARSAVPTHATLTLRASPYGKVLFDAQGRVLYLFAADHTSKSTCYGACAKAWPPFLTRGKPTVRAAGLKARLLATTRRRDGSLQVTYNGHPLYYFEEDKVGKILCQNMKLHGGFWYVVNPDGSANKAKSKVHM